MDCALCQQPAISQLETANYTVPLCANHATKDQREIVLSFVEYTENDGQMSYGQFAQNLFQLRQSSAHPVTGKQMALTEKRLFG